ncbi:anti-sigma factor domain-containing protein [Mangrovimonas sp. DI 80]|uniref:anti-sigma factor n=1 Tax=Mangrovimonas sp. DI 80 TaxID=1779330 RepID=UPI000975C7DF|nr:anti-sigma factor [Mangrovimonas sp. DI 80]OMP32666.1 RNA polymerase subunit sigma-70 [Mangrovimonas sp. DI 80]
METTLQSFLKSDLLDKYILGTADASEILEVEHFISKYPEAHDEYIRLQDNLEILAKSNAVEAPQFILDSIHKAIEKEKTKKETPVISLTQTRVKRKKTWYRYSIAASIVAFIFASAAFLLYQQNILLQQENQVVVDELFDLRNDIENNNEKLDNLMRQFMKLNNPETEKYVLRGNDRAKDLKTVAYINAVDKTSMIDVVSLPQLPEDQTYQIWAELQGKMVNLGILDASDRKLKPIPYMEDALGLSITIEPKEGQNNAASAENEVAEISLKNN